MTFTGSYIYYENSGELVIDYQLGQKTIYNYNYMKVEEYTDDTNTLILTRYCFIQDIKLKNDCAYIDYIEDVWSSYSDKISGTTESYLCNSRLLSYPNSYSISLRKLPVDYDGNKSPIINSEEHTSFSILVKIQYYNAAKYGESTERDYDVFLLHNLIRSFRVDGSTKIRTIVNDTISFSISEVYEIVNKIVKYQSSQKIFNTETATTATRYFEVSDFIIIPSTFIFDSWFEDIEYVNDTHGRNLISYFIADEPIDLDAPVSYNEPYYVLRKVKSSSSDRFQTGYLKVFNNDFKRISYGTFNTQISCINNGNQFNVSVVFYFSKGMISIFLKSQNALVDITNDFVYIVPFTSILGEENAMRNLTRAITNVSFGTEIGKELLSVGTNIASFGTGTNSLNERIKKLMYTKSGRITTSNSRLEKAERLMQRQRDMIFDVPTMFEGLFNLPFNDVMKINAPLYTTNKGTFAKSEGILNAKFGIFDITINPSNEDSVNKTINNGGYEVYEIINDFNKLALNNPSYFINNSYYYNFIKFEYVNLYGSFSRNIALVLNSILENGVKIWFDYKMREDNYVI